MFSDPDQDNDGEAANDLPPIDDDDLSVPQPPLPQVPQQPPPVQRQPLPDVDMIQMMQMDFRHQHKFLFTSYIMHFLHRFAYFAYFVN